MEDGLISEPPKRLPKAWDAPPPYRPVVQKVGDAWIRSGASLALRVPASVLPLRSNILIHPAHPQVGRVREIERARLAWPRRLMEHLAAARDGTSSG